MAFSHGRYGDDVDAVSPLILPQHGAFMTVAVNKEGTPAGVAGSRSHRGGRKGGGFHHGSNDALDKNVTPVNYAAWNNGLGISRTGIPWSTLSHNFALIDYDGKPSGSNSSGRGSSVSSARVPERPTVVVPSWNIVETNGEGGVSLADDDDEDDYEEDGEIVSLPPMLYVEDAEYAKRHSEHLASMKEEYDRINEERSRSRQEARQSASSNRAAGSSGSSAGTKKSSSAVSTPTKKKARAPVKSTGSASTTKTPRSSGRGAVAASSPASSSRRGKRNRQALEKDAAQGKASKSGAGVGTRSSKRGRHPQSATPTSGRSMRSSSRQQSRNSTSAPSSSASAVGKRPTRATRSSNRKRK